MTLSPSRSTAALTALERLGFSLPLLLAACSGASVDGATPAGGAGGEPNAPGSGGSTALSDEPAGIQYFGRWERGEEDEATGSWGALYFKARFEGTSVTLLLEDATNEFQYRVDGGELQRLSPNAETRYELASGLADGEHSLEVYRRTGGSFGRTMVRGVELDPGKKLLVPFARRDRSIEVVGDSISVGYGNEGQNGTTRETENGYDAYGPQLARLLDAEWSVIAHSGQGLFRNLGEEKSDVDETLQMPEEFELTFFPGATPNPPWDFSRFEPDVFLITLGTNDFSWKTWNIDPGPDWEPTEEEYTGAARAFLASVREKYPTTEIFVVGTFIANDGNQFGRANEYLCAAVEEFADERVHCVDPGANGPGGAWLTRASDFIGDWTHPTVASHTIIAEHLRDVIAPVLGW